MVYINPTAHAEQDQTWEKIKERGELRVGLSADYAPMELSIQLMVRLSMQV